MPSSTENSTNMQNDTPHSLRIDLLRKHSILSTDSSLEIEIQRFIERRENIDNILLFWKNNKHLYPKLSKIAKVLLAIPATTSKSGSAFSIAGCLIRSKRARIEPYRSERVLFVHDNYYLVNTK